MPGVETTVSPPSLNLRMKNSYYVEDALTGDKLAGPFLTEPGAESRLKQLRKGCPAAFVNKVKG